MGLIGQDRGWFGAAFSVPGGSVAGDTAGSLFFLGDRDPKKLLGVHGGLSICVAPKHVFLFCFLWLSSDNRGKWGYLQNRYTDMKMARAPW